MKKLYTYIFLPLTAFLAVCCNSEEDNTVSNQQTRIENYLGNQGLSRNEYTVKDTDIYRYVIDDNRTGAALKEGDQVSFYFAAYEFTTTRVEPTFYTNIGELIDQLKDNGMNPVFLSREPETVTLGKSKLIKSLEQGIKGCHKGDSVRIFLTSNLAYGANYVGTLPYDSAVEYTVKILTPEEEERLVNKE